MTKLKLSGIDAGKSFDHNVVAEDVYSSERRGPRLCDMPDWMVKCYVNRSIPIGYSGGRVKCGENV